MADARHPVPVSEAESRDVGTLSVTVPHQADHNAQGTAAPYGHRWCPYCGADLSGVPVREDDPQEAMFALAGRRLKVALLVAFVVIWLVVQIWDWIDDPAMVLVPGWYSALGAVLLFYLLGLDPTGYFRRRSRS